MKSQMLMWNRKCTLWTLIIATLQLEDKENSKWDDLLSFLYWVGKSKNLDVIRDTEGWHGCTGDDVHGWGGLMMCKGLLAYLAHLMGTWVVTKFQCMVFIKIINHFQGVAQWFVNSGWDLSEWIMSIYLEMGYLSILLSNASSSRKFWSLYPSGKPWFLGMIPMSDDLIPTCARFNFQFIKVSGPLLCSLRLLF